MSNKDDRCYMCRRTLEECKEYLESVKSDFKDRVTDDLFLKNHYWWSKDDIPYVGEQFDKITEYGMSKMEFCHIRCMKGPLESVFVPLCPICDGIFSSMIDPIHIDISEMQDDIENLIDESKDGE